MTAVAAAEMLRFEFNETLEQARARNIRDALLEDVGRGDWTGRLLPQGRVRAQVRVREAAVLAGRDWFDGCMHAVDADTVEHWRYEEGADMTADSVVCDLEGDARALLTGERPSQKYAVRVGGGANQRLALWHGILIKENHIAAAGGVTQALLRAKALNAGADIQIEVETLDQLREALAGGATSVLLDNFSVAQLREAVAVCTGRALLEASGGLSLERLRDVAATGVDRISIGKLTKDVRAIDYSMRVVAG
jgi:nicotinate-nucleotide pyrophosphorylase (carboxylating)